MGRGHLSLGTMILTVEPGGKRRGSFVSRNNDSNCRTREKEGGGSFFNRNNNSNCRTRGKEGGGHLSLGTMILTVEPGGKREGVICL